MHIFVHSRGQRLGPLPLEEINKQLQAAQILPDDLAWHEGLPSWIPLRNVQGVVVPEGMSQSPAVAAPLPGEVAPAVLPVGTVAPSAGTDPLAICSLVFGILGMICCGSLVLSVAAAVCGHISLSKTKKNPQLAGRGLAIAGVILGYLGLVIGAIWLIFYLGFGFISAFSEGMS
jgi:hypothetical protein